MVRVQRSPTMRPSGRRLPKNSSTSSLCLLVTNVLSSPLNASLMVVRGSYSLLSFLFRGVKA